VHIFDYSIVVCYLPAMVFFGFRVRRKASEGIESYFFRQSFHALVDPELFRDGLQFRCGGDRDHYNLFFVMGISGYLVLYDLSLPLS